MGFNPVLAAMHRKQELIDKESKMSKPSRLVPSDSAALIISKESDEGFLDVQIISPEGDSETDLSEQYFAVLRALQLLEQELFGEGEEDEENEENEDSEEFVELDPDSFGIDFDHIEED